MTEPIKLMKIVELADSFQISPDTVRRRIKEGAWPCTKLKGSIRFTTEQRDAILALHAQEVITPGPRTRRKHSTRRRAA